MSLFLSWFPSCQSVSEYIFLEHSCLLLRPCSGSALVHLPDERQYRNHLCVRTSIEQTNQHAHVCALPPSRPIIMAVCALPPSRPISMPTCAHFHQADQSACPRVCTSTKQTNHHGMCAHFHQADQSAGPCVCTSTKQTNQHAHMPTCAHFHQADQSAGPCVRTSTKQTNQQAHVCAPPPSRPINQQAHVCAPPPSRPISRPMCAHLHQADQSAGPRVSRSTERTNECVRVCHRCD